MRRIGAVLTLTMLTLFSTLLVANSVIPVYAWDLFVNPGSKTIAPGHTGAFTVSVTGTIPGNPNVQLLISPPVLGITAAFSTNNVPAPFSSTMIVSVDPSKAPGAYDLGLWAHPAGELFPGPGNRNANIHIIVGAPFDYSLQLSPPSVTVKQGETASYQIFITYSDPSYSGTTITVDLSGLGPGMNYQLIPSPPSLNILTSQATPPGSYTIVLTGSAIGVIHQTSALLTVQPAEQPFDFSITASPPQQTISPGGSTTYEIAVNLASGTSQNVVLSVSGVPGGVSTSLNPTSGNPSFGSILTVSASSSVAPGQYLLTVTGSAGSKTHNAAVTLIVGQAPDFRIDVSPPSQTSTQGQTTSYSINVVGLNGFNSQVSLNVNGLPAGASGVFSVPSSVPPYSSTLTITIPNNSPIGSFTLIITGSGGGITRTANVVLGVNPSQTTTQTTTQPSASGLVDMLQQNSLIIIAALAILAIILAALAMRKRGTKAVTARDQLRSAMGAAAIFCGKCGSQNPASSEFCANCGQKLRRFNQS